MSCIHGAAQKMREGFRRSYGESKVGLGPDRRRRNCGKGLERKKKNMQNEIEGLVDRLLGANVSLEEATEILERSMISAAMTQHRGNQSAASKQLGIHRNTLRRKVLEYGLRRKPVTAESRTRRRRRSGTS